MDGYGPRPGGWAWAAGDLTRRVPDSTKARTVLGWSCKTALADGLARTIEWARGNPWWLALPDSGAS